MKGINLLVAIAFASSPTACTDQIAEFFAGEAVATDSIGFIAGEKYPHRNTVYDHYLPEVHSVDQAALHTLFNHVAMPQSRSALIALLGYPISEDGKYSYWRISGSSEIAVYFDGDTAYSFTVVGF